jgi:hypothetical protein
MAHTSYWEAELFYALLLLKETPVFEIDGFSPEPKLAAVLDVLRVSVPRERWSRVSDLKTLPSHVERYLVSRLGIKPSPKLHRIRSLRHFVEGLFRLRGRDGCGGAAEAETLQFFDGASSDRTVNLIST